MKSSKLIMGCLATLGLTAGIAVAQDGTEREAIAERLKPVGELCLQGEDCGTAMAASGGDSPASGGGGDIDGESIYNNVCMACHETGAAGAPIRGDEAAWAPRVEQGFATLLDHSINGFNAMPARGGNPNLSDAEMEAATAYMVEPVMDVPAQNGGAATTASVEDGDQAASGDGEASAESQGSASTATADAGQQEQAMAQDGDNAEQAANADQGGAAEAATTSTDQSGTTETAAASAASAGGGSDLPGADKIGTCVACHGQDGQGTAPIYPNLAGQNATYLENALKAYRAGERQGGMSAVMTPMATSLSDEDITDLAEYYSQQTP